MGGVWFFALVVTQQLVITSLKPFQLKSAHISFIIFESKVVYNVVHDGELLFQFLTILSTG